MNPVDVLTRCVECDEWIDPLEQPHAAHEPSCAVDPDCEDWSCRCDAYAHKRCCRACPPAMIPGQVEAFPVASTRGLPKMAHP